MFKKFVQWNFSQFIHKYIAIHVKPFSFWFQQLFAISYET
jgi:hypothetical protein